MGRKRVIIGQSEYGIDEAQVEEVTTQIKEAMETGTVAALPLLDGANRRVTVYLNGRITPSVVVDLEIEGPKPTEISGG
jgi:hypothetical protein